jgi:hypothetical protein
MELHLKTQNKIAFVVGNGTSRSGINLPELINYGTVYGCNAQYREYAPDHLVAVDVKMIKEIVKNKYHLSHLVWTNPNKDVKEIDGLNFLSPHRGWASGPTALWLAAKTGYNKIYILGFDYQGLQGKVNNVYAGTTNYKNPNDKATYYGNWLNQTKRAVNEFANTKFYRVIEEHSFVPHELESLKNLEHMLRNDFELTYKNCLT